MILSKYCNSFFPAIDEQFSAVNFYVKLVLNVSTPFFLSRFLMNSEIKICSTCPHMYRFVIGIMVGDLESSEIRVARGSFLTHVL